MNGRLQIGTYRQRLPGRGGALATAAAWVVTPLTIAPALAADPGPPTLVRLLLPYAPCARDGFPARGTDYHGGETAAFPQAEAAALVAAGVATYP